MADNYFEHEKKNKPDEQGAFGWSVLIRIAVMIFVTFSCCTLFFFLIFRFQGVSDGWKKLLNSAQPIIIGAVLAYLMNPIMKFQERKVYPFVHKYEKEERKAWKFSRAIAISGTTLFLILLIVLAIRTLVPAVVNSVLRLLRMLPTYVNSTTEQLENGYFSDNDITAYITDQITQGMDSIEKWATSTLLPQAQNYITYITHITSGLLSIVSFLMDFIVGIIVMIYVMAIQDTLMAQSKKVIYAFLPARVGNMIIEITRKGDEIFGGFLTGKVIDSAIIGVITYIGCSLMKMPDTVLVSCIIGITNIIPFFGPFIGAVPSLLLVVIQSPWHALYLLIFIIVLQQVDGNIIGPKILGSSTGLSSFWVMVAILIGGGMFGFSGMILGVPVFALLYYLFKRLINHRITKKKLPTNTEAYASLDHVDIISGAMVPFQEGKKKHHNQVKDDAKSGQE